MNLFHLHSLRRLKLDIVGFLAILGEASVVEISQNVFLSPWGFLPRLVPAPQALLRTTRPSRLRTESAVVVGAQSGNKKSELSHLAHILHNTEKLKRYHVKRLEIRNRKAPANYGEDSKGHLKLSTPGKDPVSNDKSYPDAEARIKRWGYLTWLAIGAFIMFLLLVALSVHFEDGMALIATLLLGSLSSLIQFGSKSTLKLAHFTPKKDRFLPEGNVVVRYPNGSFVYVECKEDIARKLYFAPEECVYVAGARTYRLIALIGTLMLMASVITLANAKSVMQIAYAAAYLLLNTATWAGAAVSPKMHWDLNDFEIVTEERIATTNFTQALWTMIALSGTTKWVSISESAPSIEAWNKWLSEAEKQLQKHGRLKIGTDGRIEGSTWNPQEALDKYLNDMPSGPPLSPEEHMQQEFNSEAFDEVAMQPAEAMAGGWKGV